MGSKPSDILQALLQSRLALIGVGIGVPGLFAAAIVRLIPWTLFLLILVVAVVGFVAFLFLRQWWAMRKDRRLEEGLDAQTSKDIGGRRVRDRKDIRDLQEKWKQSVETLRKSRIGKQRRPLYFLPWYAIIGAPRCGKTTAIQNSGLNFPGGDAKLKGIGGTKNCDWFFADEAIILDTAGRYTFGDESEPDRDEWIEFLKLLRKYRPLEPLNGLIVAVSAEVLMSEDRDEVLTHARSIRHKTDEIVRELGIQFPVYILLTKCDLIEGFTDFFGHLKPRAHLDELLGWTNPSWEMGDPRTLVGGAMAELRARVLALRTQFLHEEERPDALRKIYLFPLELAAFEENLVEFCDVLFRTTQYNESPFLRGIYLTSGMQTGTAVSRMLARLGLRAEATQLREEQRSYFLKDFFKGRLPADRKLVAMTGHTRGRLQVVHNVGLVSAALVCTVVTVLAGGAYVANRTLLNDVQDEMERAVGPQQTAPAERVTALGHYASALELLQYRNERRPWYTGMGLYTGNGAFEPARRLFVKEFSGQDYLPAIEGARRALRDRSPDHGFLGLEAVVRDYKLSREFNGRPLDVVGAEPPEPVDSLLLFWPGAQTEVGEDVRKAFGRSYLDLLRWRDPATANAEQERDLVLIRETVPEMLTVDRVATWADRFYKPVRAEDFRLPPALANGAVVRGAFTLAAIQQRVKPLTDAVVDVDPERTRQLRREYVARYYGAWLDFITRPKEAADGVLPLELLLGEQTPYLALLDRTAAETAIGVSQPPAWAATVARLSAERGGYRAHLQNLAREVGVARSSPAVALDAAKKIFLTPVVPGGDDAGPPDAFGKAETWVTRTTEGIAGADADDARVRARSSVLLRVPVYAAFGAYLHAVHGEIDRLWNASVRGVGRDVAALYGPSGVVWQFYTQQLEPFLDRLQNYAPKVRYTKALPVSPALPGFLRKAEKIAAAGAVGRRFKILFDTLPTTDPARGDARVTRTVLTIFCGEDEPWRLEHRQFHISKQLLWAPDVCTRTELRVFLGGPAGGVEDRALDPIVADGPLALFDFLRQASRNGREYSWTFPDGVTATFLISAPPEFFTLMEAGSPPTSL